MHIYIAGCIKHFLKEINLCILFLPSGFDILVFSSQDFEICFGFHSLGSC